MNCVRLNFFLFAVDVRCAFLLRISVLRRCLRSELFRFMSAAALSHLVGKLFFVFTVRCRRRQNMMFRAFGNEWH